MDLVIREIREEDHEAVGDLIVRAYDQVGTFTDDYRSFLRAPEEWVEGVTDVFVCVTETTREVVGAVAFTLPGDPHFERFDPPVADAGFRFLAVDPETQGRGAGRALVARCVRAAEDHGCSRMVIHSMEFMSRAHRLYRRMGFSRRPDLDVRFPAGTAYAFALDLAADASERFPEPGPVPDEPPWYEDVMTV